VAVTVACVFVARGLLLVGLFEARRQLDQHQYVSALRLEAALKTFRPPDRDGLAARLEMGDLAPERSVRTEPSRCAPLSLLATTAALDGHTWTGVNGSPAQPVTTLTVRYADASLARRELLRKRVALLRCRTVSLTFPPFDQPAQDFSVEGVGATLSAVGDRLRYLLSGGGKSYGFYVRRYSNTLTWTYADDVSTPNVRQQVVDDLVDRLRQLNRE
jgi:hypothetical protein